MALTNPQSSLDPTCVPPDAAAVSDGRGTRTTDGYPLDLVDRYWHGLVAHGPATPGQIKTRLLLTPFVSAVKKYGFDCDGNMITCPFFSPIRAKHGSDRDGNMIEVSFFPIGERHD